jgi:hypothetical protein
LQIPRKRGGQKHERAMASGGTCTQNAEEDVKGDFTWWVSVDKSSVRAEQPPSIALEAGLSEPTDFEGFGPLWQWE